MITLSVSISGPQIAGELTNDEEELAYFLSELAENLEAERLAQATENYLHISRCKEIGEYLKEVGNCLLKNCE